MEYPLSNYRPQTKFVKVMISQVSVCPEGGGVCLWSGGGHLPHMHPPVIYPPGRHLPPGQTLPGQTLPRVDTPWADTPQADTALPSACWDTPPAQCMLEYGRQVGGTLSTGMHSCFSNINYVFRQIICRSKGNARDTCLTFAPMSMIFMHFLAKILPKNSLAHPHLGSAHLSL